MTRYFITGAQGFVGRYLVAHLLGADSNAEIIGAGRSPQSDRTFTHKIRRSGKQIAAPLPDTLCPKERYRYVSVDIHNRLEFREHLKISKPDVIIHLASGLRDDPPAALFRTNVEGSAALLDAIVASGVGPRRVIMGSTGGVYGRPKQLPLSEDAPCDPIDPYCASKLAAEEASRRYELPLIWARLFNLVGPGQDERHICGELASRAAAICAGVEPPVIEVGTLHTTRDMIDVRDVASALALLAAKGEPDTRYNVASGVETSMKDVVETIVRAAGLAGKAEIRQTRFRAADIPRHFAYTGRLQRLGFAPRFTLEDSIRDVLRYYSSDLSH
jgi:nucleoside-diphosphate-sugar epimerase